MDLNNLDDYLDFSRLVFPKLEFQSQETRQMWVIESPQPKLVSNADYWSCNGLTDCLDSAELFESLVEALRAINGLKSIYKEREFRAVEVAVVVDSRVLS